MTTLDHGFVTVGVKTVRAQPTAVTSEAERYDQDQNGPSPAEPIRLRHELAAEPGAVNIATAVLPASGSANETLH